MFSSRVLRVPLLLTLVSTSLVLSGCPLKQEEAEAILAAASQAAPRYLYVASGACYSGGVAASAASNTIAKYELKTGKLEGVIADYNTFAIGDSPVGLAPYGLSLLVAVENTGGRRIDRLARNGSSLATHLVNSTALNGALRDIKLASDGSLFVSKSTAIEKFSTGKARLTQGANAFIQAPAGNCATSATLNTSVNILSNGKILYTHAAATPNNMIGIIAANGYAAAGDCLSATKVQGPTTTALPTASLVHPSGSLLVAYASTTLGSNSITAYDLDISANTITNATAAYTNTGVINGVSAMTVDSQTGDVFVANAAAAFNTIERFTFDQGTKTLTRVGTQPYIDQSVYTRCISSMLISE